MSIPALVEPRLLDAWPPDRSRLRRWLKSIAVARYRWLLEEYRVSLFAQALGTALPVSEARLDAALAEVAT